MVAAGRAGRAGAQPLSARLGGLLPLRELGPSFPPARVPGGRPPRAVCGQPPSTLTSVRPVGGALPLPGSPGLDHARRNCRCAQTRKGLAGLAECRRRRMSESRVRENRMHGSRRRREETGTKSALPHGAGASRRPYIELGNRSVHLAGCTANPTGTWVTQQARQFAWTLQERPGSFCFLIRDRDSKFTREFGAVFASE